MGMKDFRHPRMHPPLPEALLQLKPEHAPCLPKIPKKKCSNPLDKDAAHPRHMLSPICSYLLARSCDLVPAGEMRLIWRSPRRGCEMLSRTTTCSK